MIAEEIHAFGRSHDPDDVASRNADIGGLLRRVEGTYNAVDVFLDSSNTDSALALSVIAYNPTSQKVSWRQTGGTRTNRALDGDGVTMRLGYRIVVRVYLTDGRHYDQSVFQEIADH